MTVADQIWNRAATEAGGELPGPGDRALAALLLAHGLVMNGGVHHALECMEPTELVAAIDGYSFFGLHDVADWVGSSTTDPVLASWTDETEAAANQRYEVMVPGDDRLVDLFEAVLCQRPEAFAPIEQHG